jgi:hypothetical protein
MDKSATLLLNGKTYPVVTIKPRGAVIYLDEHGNQRFAYAPTFVGSTLIAEKFGQK